MSLLHLLLVCVIYIGVLTAIACWYSPISVPVFSVSQIRRSAMDILTYRVDVAPPVDADVVSRELVVSIDDFSTSYVVAPGTAFDTFDAKQGANVKLELTDIDDAGNRSIPAVVEFVATDTLPPSTPTGFVVEVTAERHVEDTPVVDEVAPEASSEPTPE
jgi:hypothetical protein